jgi:hypothetical protein
MYRLLLVVLAALVVGCGPSPESIGSPSPASTTVTQGRFVLSFTIAQATVRSRDEISGTARLSLLGPGGATITGSGSLFMFEFSEVGGNGRHVVPVNDAVCAPHRVTSTTPLDSPILKSGGVLPGPDSQWYLEFLRGPKVQLPAGDWDITSIALFYDGRDCAGQYLDMRATVRVHVIE